MTRFFKKLAVLAFIFLLAGKAFAAPSVVSESAVLIDAKSGQVLYDKNMHEVRFPASITKIATVICGLENGNLSDKIVMSDEAVFSVSRDSSHIALDVGEEITLEEACYASLLVSANDACNGIAEATGGSIENFVSMMNDLAVRAGAKNTHFTNTNGLRDDNHYTTAYDMAMICRYAIKNPDFLKIFGTYKYTMPSNNKQPEERLFVNQHGMISDPAILYDGFIGGKTGWTTVALHTLVTAAERGDKRLIAVVMKSPSRKDRYNDTKALLDYGFESFGSLTITNSDIPKGSGAFLPEGSVDISVPEGTTREDITISTMMEDGVDYIVASYADGTEVSRIPCSVEVYVPERKEVIPPPGMSPFLILLFVLLSIILLFVLLILGVIIRKKIYRAIRRHKRRKRRY